MSIHWSYSGGEKDLYREKDDIYNMKKNLSPRELIGDDLHLMPIYSLLLLVLFIQIDCSGVSFRDYSYFSRPDYATIYGIITHDLKV